MKGNSIRFIRSSGQFIAILFFFITAVSSFSCKGKGEEVKQIRYNGSYNRDFNDLNDLHLTSAQKIGIDPVSSRDEAKEIENELREISTTKTYEVEDLSHSIPYLVPKAADLLDKVGENFSDSLKSLNAPKYKLIVTSLTRTNSDVKSLRKRNINSSQNSAHLYATTFDISWVRFKKDDGNGVDLTPDELKMVLASVLRDLKKENACYIKHEKKQGCFHITAR